MKDTDLSPFINILYGAVITSVLLIIIGVIAKFDIITIEYYDLKSLESTGLILLVSSVLLFGFFFLVIANEEEKEENKQNKL